MYPHKGVPLDLLMVKVLLLSIDHGNSCFL
jgi:hypothetical protein